MPATRAARSASGPSATTVTVSPSISAEPASTAPSASDARIRVRGGRRSRSSSAGSRITQRPRSLISGRFASARAAISSASSSAPSSVSCQRKSSSAARPNPASVSFSGAGVATAAQFEAVAEHAGRPQHLDAGTRQLLGGRAEQAGERVVVEVDDRRAGLLAAPELAAAISPRRAGAPAAGPSPPASRTWRARSPAGSTARRRRRSGSDRRCCAAAAPAGTVRAGAASALRSAQVPSSQVSSPPQRRRFLVRAAGAAGTASIRRPRRAPADRPSVVSASHSARSLTRGRLSRGERRRRGGPGRGGRACDRVGDRVPQVADQRIRRAEPHRARAGNRQGVRGGREHGGEFAQPAEVGRIERPGPPDIRVIGAYGRQEPAAGNQAHARGSGRRPDPGAAPHRPPGLLIGTEGEQGRKSLGERDEIGRDQALAYAVGAAGEDQLQLGGSRALAPEREHAPPGNLARHEDQLAIQHGTARYRFSCQAVRNFRRVQLIRNDRPAWPRRSSR